MKEVDICSLLKCSPAVSAAERAEIAPWDLPTMTAET